MNNISLILKRRIKICLWMLLYFMLAFLLTGQSFAQKEPDVSSQPYKINGKEVKEYLMEKYKLQKDDVDSRIQQTPNGPIGKLSIMGENITPVAAVATGDVKTRARSVAKVFLREEAVLLGISNMVELKEMAIDVFTSPYTNLTTTNIYYRRYINNLELENASIRIAVGQGDKIKSVYAEVVPTPPELYQAIAKTALTESDIRRIIEDDFNASINSQATSPMVKKFMKEEDIAKIRLEKVGISSAPYVVWKVNSVWVYTIDAFTGKILEKLQGWQD